MLRYLRIAVSTICLIVSVLLMATWGHGIVIVCGKMGRTRINNNPDSSPIPLPRRAKYAA